nr:MAG TPA_asm: hypothetical protein [Caudoviricetes sp.]
MKKRLAKKIFCVSSNYWRIRRIYFDVISQGDHRIYKAIRILNKSHKKHGED